MKLAAAAALFLGCAKLAEPVATPDADVVETSIDSTVAMDSSLEAATDSHLPMPDSTTEVVASSCASPLSGTMPFSARLSGSIATDAGSQMASVDVYFPHGRVAGREVVIAFATSWRPRISVARGVLDSSLSSGPLSVTDLACDDSVKGRFIGPSDGLDADVMVNLSGPWTDALILANGHTTLCPSGTTPVASVTPPIDRLPIGDAFVVDGNVPLDSASLASIVSSPTHSLKVTENGGAFVVSVDSPSPFRALVIDFSGVRDVMGNPLGLGTAKMLALDAVVSDPTFSTAPPPGAVLGTVVSTFGGVLRIGTGGGDAGGGGASYHAIVGLGSALPSKKLRLRQRADCSSSMMHPAATLVSETGATKSVIVECLSVPADVSIDLPDTGRWALDVRVDGYDSKPCNYPAPKGPSAAYELDEFAFE